MGKILITGGAGFIGSHLCELYLNSGDQVICVDNLISGSESNIEQFKQNSNFTFLNHDVTELLPDDIGELDAILHFASPASPNPDSSVSYMANPIKTLMVNSLGTKHMLDLAKKNNCQIILASTSEVYGDPEVHPQTEDYVGHVSPNGPRSCYDEGKRFLEAIAFAYYRKHKTKIKVIRIFNTYGPRMRLDEGRFIPSLVASFVEDKPFTRFAGSQTSRSFCYIDDLIRGIEAIYKTDKMIAEVVNLGNPKEIKISDAIDIFEGIIGKQLEIVDKPELEDDPKRRQPDITKAKTILNWQPKIPFEKGMKMMLESYKD